MREFQREKQEIERKVFERWKAENQRDPKEPIPSIQQISDSDAIEWADPESMRYGSFQWSANLPYEPQGQQSVFSEQIGEWTPSLILPSEHDNMARGNVYFQPNVANLDFNLPSTGADNQLFDARDSFSFEDEKSSDEMISEQIECPLISSSIKRITSDPASFNAVDPFNSMPGLRSSRAQAIMHHCQSTTH